MKSIEIEIENEKQKKTKRASKLQKLLFVSLMIYKQQQQSTIKLSNGYKNPFIIKHTHTETDSYRKHIYNKKKTMFFLFGSLTINDLVFGV